MDTNLKFQILTLCTKVMEVINNNDWPTEEGHNKADEESCAIERLVNEIKSGLTFE